MLSLDQLRQLKEILRATSAPLAFESFQEFARALLDPLIELTGSRGGNLYITDATAARKPLFLWHSYDPGFVTEYQQSFYHESPIRLLLAKDVRVGQSCDVVDYDRFRTTAFYGEFLAPRRLHHLAALVARIPATGASDQKMGILGLQKKTGEAPFTVEDLEILDLLYGPVEGALHTLLLAGTERQRLELAFDAMPAGVLVLDWKLTAVYRNPALASLLAGRELTDGEWGALRALVERTRESFLAPSGGEEPAALAPSWIERDGRRLDLRTSVLPDGLLSARPHILCLFEPSTSRIRPPDEATLRSTFGLTERETEVVGRCLLGETNGQIASALGISAETVKQHLKNVFQKTGVARRSQIATLLGPL